MLLLLALMALLLAAPAAADTISEGCPCVAWRTGGTCTGSVIAINIDDPDTTAGKNGCGNQGNTAMQINLDKSYTWGCYADEYHVWIEDDGTGVDIASSTAEYHTVDRLTVGHPGTTGMVGPKNDGAGIDLDADIKGRPVSMTFLNSPGRSNIVGMPASDCQGNNYGGSDFAYTITAVPGVPTDNGQTVLRPAWTNTVKTAYSTDDIDWNILPTHSHDTPGLPSAQDINDVLRRCLPTSYMTTAHAIGGGEDVAGIPVVNYKQYTTDGATKFISCAVAAAFSQGTGAPTLAQRKRMMIGLLTEGITLLDQLKNGTNNTYPLNSGYGQNSELPLVALHAFFQPMRQAFRDRFITKLGNTSDPAGYEMAMDSATWRHGNDRVYYGNTFPPPNPDEVPISGFSCAGKHALDYDQGNACRDVSGNPDDRHGTRGGGYQVCCSTCAWFGIAGAMSAWPMWMDLWFATGLAGNKTFDYLARYDSTNGGFGQVWDGGGPGVDGLRSDLAHCPGGGGSTMWDQLGPCAFVFTGSGLTREVASFTGGCVGHSTATVPPVCGNAQLEAGEVCDLGAHGGATCITEGFGGGGPLICDVDCLGFDTSNCTAPVPGMSLVISPPDGITPQVFTLTPTVTNVASPTCIWDCDGDTVFGAECTTPPSPSCGPCSCPALTTNTYTLGVQETTETLEALGGVTVFAGAGITDIKFWQDIGDGAACPNPSAAQQVLLDPIASGAGDTIIRSQQICDCFGVEAVLNAQTVSAKLTITLDGGAPDVQPCENFPPHGWGAVSDNAPSCLPINADGVYDFLVESWDDASCDQGTGTQGASLTRTVTMEAGAGGGGSGTGAGGGVTISDAMEESGLTVDDPPNILFSTLIRRYLTEPQLTQ